MGVRSSFGSHRTWRRIGLAAGALIGLLLLQTGAGGGLDEALMSLRDAWRHHPASGQVHIVEIDGRSIQVFKQWPWPRHIHAAAIARLQDAGVRSMAFDVDFSSPSRREEDEALAAALRNAHGTVILPAFRQEAGAGSQARIDSVPLPILAENAFLASANVVTDAQGRLRAMPYASEIRGNPKPSLASMVAEQPGDVGRLFPLDLSLDPDTIPRHSMVDIVSGRVPASALAGKRILIGATAVEFGDRFVVPGHGLLPGVVIHAMAAETLLAGSPGPALGGGWPLALALTIAALASLPRTPRQRAFGHAAAWPLLLALPLLASVDLAPALGALLTAQIALGSGLARARYRERALTERETGLPNLAALEADCRGFTGLVLVVARIEDYPALTSALGADQAARLVLGAAERISFAVASHRVYRIDDAHLAWLDLGGSGLDERLDGIEALLRIPLACGQAAELRFHFGAAYETDKPIRQLCADASLAASHAAERGQRWRLFTAGDSEAVNLRVALMSELDVALSRGDLWNAYQPKLDLRTGRITGVEALVRWEHPERGALPPDSFIEAIEQSGRAGELTLHVAGQALSQAMAWARLGSPLGVAVNLSATLLHDESFMRRLQDMVEASDVPPERITIEVTESAAMADPDRAIAALEGWRRVGVGVSIDDYGTGQSSLSYLQKLPATEVKIDKSFIAAITADPRDAILVRSTIAMAHELGLQVVAEGVEEETTLRLLREMGCDIVQGYHISRPLVAADVPALARRFEERSRRRA